jgi:elongation factor G
VKDYTTDKIRTFCLAGQRGSGKTSLADAIAFSAGLNNRQGRVDDGSSLFDYTESELQRKSSIVSKLMAFDWQGTKINLLDCPGHSDFIGELLNCARVSESVGVVINAPAGVEIGTRIQWRNLSEANVSRFFFVNKMEAENTRWQNTLDSIRDAFGKQAAAVEIPIGEAAAFKGVVDLLHMKAYAYAADGKRSEIDFPADLKEIVEREHEHLIEVAAESDDELLEKYFADGTLSAEDTRKGLRLGIVRGKLYPVLFGSAARNAGVKELLEFIVEYLPSMDQLDATVVKKSGADQTIALAPSASGPAVAYIFKTISEGHLGEMSLFKTISGTVKTGSELRDVQTVSDERISHIYSLQGKNRIDVTSTPAGDIGVLVKLKKTHTGDTLCDGSLSVEVPKPSIPKPVMDLALHPKNKGDEEKLATGLHKLHEEDPTFNLVQDAALHQLVVFAQGPTQIEVLIEKLKKRFGVEVETRRPRIPFRETVTAKTEYSYKHKKQSGGRGQYGDVSIRIEPNVRGGGFEFLNEITGGVIPGKYIPAVEKGIVEQMVAGGLAGAPVVDVRVAIFYGSYHDVDSSDMAFKIAGLMAFKEGFMNCRPVLLEPIYSVEVIVPDEFTGDVMGDLSSRRGRISGMEPDGSGQRVKALVPQAELYQYSVDLRSMTQGQGIYATTFSHYEEVPHEVAQKIIEEAKANRLAEVHH